VAARVRKETVINNVEGDIAGEPCCEKLEWSSSCWKIEVEAEKIAIICNYY
jgi:hypothetical protein